MQKAIPLRYLILAGLLLPLILSAAPERPAAKQKRPFPAMKLRARTHGENAVKALGNRLPEVAAWYRMSPRKLARMLRRDRHAWLDNRGQVFYMDEFPAAQDGVESAASNVDLTSPSTIPYSETFKLHSRPGADRVLFMDFDGHSVTGTRWNVGASDPIHFPAFSRDSDHSNFSNTERDQIHDAWRRVAEDFAPFDVDVTTEDPGYAAINRSNSSDQKFGTRALITLLDSNVCGSCGGAAYLGVYDATGSSHDYYQPALVFYDRLGSGSKGIAEAVSHEVGHNLGLRHDGSESSGYYAGHGSGETGWAPIMGVGYYRNLSQWSQGEYSGATETEDDLQIMQNNGAPLNTDDHTDNLDHGASPLNGVPDGSGLVSLDGRGLIGQRNDRDVFSIDAGTGDLHIDVDPASSGPNLDIQANLYDDLGVLLASSNPANALNASISLVNQPGGIYYLEIDGVDKGDPLDTGYTDYASLGHYAVTGSIPESQFLQPPRAVISTASGLTGDAPLTVDFSGSDSVDPDGDIIGYTWDFDDNGSGSNLENPSYTFNDPGIYNVSLRVTDNDDLMNSTTVQVHVNNQPPIAMAGASVTSGVAPLTVNFSSAGSFDPDPTHSLSYFWRFGDGASSNGANPSHSYTAAGVYTTVLTVSDNLRESDSASVTITVNADQTSPPAAPTHLSANKTISGRGRNKKMHVRLDWQDNASDETHFELERCRRSGKRKNRTCTFSVLTSLPANTVTYSESVRPGVYKYRLKAVNNYGSSRFSNVVKVSRK